MKLKPDDGQRFIPVLLLLLLGLLAIGLQLSFVGMYYDDFGNASLSYGYVVEGVEGTGYTVSQLLLWARNCYLNWGGRVLYAVLFVIPLLKNGITAYMAVQTFIMIAICFTASRLICHYTDKKYSFLSICLLYLLYGLIGKTYHAHSTYWASASVLYLWPLLPLFLAFLLYIRTCERIKANQKPAYGRLLPLLAVLLFFASCSQEQVGLSVLVFLIFYIAFDHGKDWKRYRLLDGTALLVSLFSYLILFLAPGNFVRLSTHGEFANLSFWEKISTNFPKVLDLLFMENFRIFNVLLLIGTALMAAFLFNRNRRFGVMIATTLLLALIYIGMLITIINLPGLFRSVFYLLFLAHFLVVSIFYFCATGRPQVNALTITAGASVFCLLYSPSVFERCTVEYLYIVFILLGILFIDGWERFSFYILYRLAVSAGIVLLGILAAVNFTSILKGYYKNSFYNKYNHQVLSQYQEGDGNLIFLARLPEFHYRSEMPYDDGKDFIHAWYRQYYNLPEHVSIQWGELGVERTFAIEGDFYEDGWFGETATITILNEKMRSLTFRYYISEDAPGEKGLVFTVNGNETTVYLEPGENHFSFSFDGTAEGPLKIQLSALSTYRPVDTGISLDERELSMILRISQ